MRLKTLAAAAPVAAVEHIFTGGVHNAAYLSAQEASQIQGAWFQTENGHQERPQGSGPPPCKGQSKAVRLSVWKAYTANMRL